MSEVLDEQAPQDTISMGRSTLMGDSAGGSMGDRGGKKDKQKTKQQQVKKHQAETDRKLEKAHPKESTVAPAR